MFPINATAEVPSTEVYTAISPSISSSPMRLARRARQGTSSSPAGSPYCKESRPIQYSPKTRRPGSFAWSIPQDFAVRLFNAVSRAEYKLLARKTTDASEAGGAADGSLHSDGADTTLVSDIPDSSSVETVVPSPQRNGDKLKERETASQFTGARSMGHRWSPGPSLHEKMDIFSSKTLGQHSLVPPHSRQTCATSVSKAGSPSRPTRVPLFSALPGNAAVGSSVWTLRDLPSILHDEDEELSQSTRDSRVHDERNVTDTEIASGASDYRVDALAVLFRRLSLDETVLIFPVGQLDSLYRRIFLYGQRSRYVHLKNESRVFERKVLWPEFGQWTPAL